MRGKIVGALIAASVLGVGAFAVAAENEVQPRACGNITGGGGSFETAPAPVTGEISGGRLNFDVQLAEASCTDLSYGLVVLDEAPGGEQPPVVLDAVTVQGDGTNASLRYSLEVADDDPVVCVYSTTFGGTGTSPTGKTGAAFDGNAAPVLLDRAPDNSGDAGYCLEVQGDGGGGSGYH